MAVVVVGVDVLAEETETADAAAAERWLNILVALLHHHSVGPE